MSFQVITSFEQFSASFALVFPDIAVNNFMLSDFRWRFECFLHISHLNFLSLLWTCIKCWSKLIFLWNFMSHFEHSIFLEFLQIFWRFLRYPFVLKAIWHTLQFKFPSVKCPWWFWLKSSPFLLNVFPHFLRLRELKRKCFWTWLLMFCLPLNFLPQTSHSNRRSITWSSTSSAFVFVECCPWYLRRKLQGFKKK